MADRGGGFEADLGGGGLRVDDGAVRMEKIEVNGGCEVKGAKKSYGLV